VVRWLGCGQGDRCHCQRCRTELTAKSFHALHPGKSINTGGFVMAVLKDLGLIRANEENTRLHEHVPATTFEKVAMVRMGKPLRLQRQPSLQSAKRRELELVESITVALIAAAVLGMWFSATRWISISAMALLCFLYPWLGVLIVLIGSAAAFLSIQSSQTLKGNHRVTFLF
jgi:hypothetical protein